MLAREGVGESQFRRGDIHCGLCKYMYFVLIPLPLRKLKREGERGDMRKYRKLSLPSLAVQAGPKIPSPLNVPEKVGISTLIKNEIKFSLYIRKFRVEQLQSHIYEEGIPYEDMRKYFTIFEKAGSHI